jgi:hypothetical protein
MRIRSRIRINKSDERIRGTGSVPRSATLVSTRVAAPDPHYILKLDPNSGKDVDAHNGSRLEAQNEALGGL